MEAVRAEEILDPRSYHLCREELRTRFMAIKESRRVGVGDRLTVLFENHDTVRYQIQEMVYTEQLENELELRHEVETYNELLGGPGELGCTVLVELDDPVERDRLLERWQGLCEALYLVLFDGQRVRAHFDERQVGEQRISAVQFLKFDTDGQVPVAVGYDFPDEAFETILNPEQRAALANDLNALHPSIESAA